MSNGSSTLPAVVVTGAGSGIGSLTADYLSKQGFHVFAGVRKDVDIERLKQAANAHLTPLHLDITDEHSRQAAAEEVGEIVGDKGIVGLINNAGLSLCSPLEHASQAHLELQLHTNCIGPIMTCQAFLPLLKAARGRIINLSSGVGKLAIPLMGGYSGSKFALEGMTDALRVELRQCHIPVCLVIPGFVNTPIHGKNDEDMAKIQSGIADDRYKRAIKHYIQRMHKMAKTGTPTDVAVKVIYKALTDKNPKTRYPVGKDAALLGIINGFLPDRLRDFIVGNMTNL